MHVVLSSNVVEVRSARVWQMACGKYTHDEKQLWSHFCPFEGWAIDRLSLLPFVTEAILTQQIRSGKSSHSYANPARKS